MWTLTVLAPTTKLQHNHKMNILAWLSDVTSQTRKMRGWKDEKRKDGDDTEIWYKRLKKKAAERRKSSCSRHAVMLVDSPGVGNQLCWKHWGLMQALWFSTSSQSSLSSWKASYKKIALQLEASCVTDEQRRRADSTISLYLWSLQHLLQALKCFPPENMTSETQTHIWLAFVWKTNSKAGDGPLELWELPISPESVFMPVAAEHTVGV